MRDVRADKTCYRHIRRPYDAQTLAAAFAQAILHRERAGHQLVASLSRFFIIKGGTVRRDMRLVAGRRNVPLRTGSFA